MENTAKNFALQLGSLITLYVSIGAITTLLFGVVNVQYPDAALGYYNYESSASGIRFGIALLIVFFPAYVILTRMVNTIRRSEHGTYLTLTKWLIYLSLVVGGGVLLGDLVAVINSFLNGEMTIRFILKALILFVVTGCAFVYYLFDARGYWQTHEVQSMQYAGGATVLVIAALVFGFMNTETPAEVREIKLDTTQINDLSLIQSRIDEYYRIHNALPDSITTAFIGIDAPLAPESRNAYRYERTSESEFSLCATFAAASTQDGMFYAPTVYVSNDIIKNPDNWTHEAGEWCFTRYVNPTPVAPAEVKMIK